VEPYLVYRYAITTDALSYVIALSPSTKDLGFLRFKMLRERFHTMQVTGSDRKEDEERAF